MLSSLADHLGRFNMAHIQSSSLAGGIAIGAVANVILYPHHAIVVGAAAALVSVLGHVYVTVNFWDFLNLILKYFKKRNAFLKYSYIEYLILNFGFFFIFLI